MKKALGTVLLAAMAGAFALDFMPASYAQTAEPLVVRVAATSRVRARTLLLSDVASVSGPEPLAAALRAREIGPSPPPGFTQALALETVAERLRAAGVDTKSVRIEGAAEAAVTCEAATIRGRDLVEAARARILRDAADFAPDAEIVPEARSSPADVVVAPGRTGTEVAIRARPGARTGRNVWVDAIVTVDGEPAAVVALQFDVRVFREAATTTRAVSRGEVLGPETLVLSRADVSGGGGGLPVTSLDEALGLAAARAIPAGAVVRSHDLFRPPIVRRGDVVTLRVKYGEMTITARGVARTEGAKGDVVSVTNSDTNRVVSGRVTEAGLVDVEIARPFEEKP